MAALSFKINYATITEDDYEVTITLNFAVINKVSSWDGAGLKLSLEQCNADIF